MIEYLLQPFIECSKTGRRVITNNVQLDDFNMVNYDEINKTSVGWCLRDHVGRFVLGGTHWKERRCSIAEGESIALLQAMKELKFRGISSYF
jgi:hypothetical protein